MWNSFLVDDAVKRKKIEKVVIDKFGAVI